MLKMTRVCTYKTKRATADSVLFLSVALNIIHIANNSGQFYGRPDH